MLELQDDHKMDIFPGIIAEYDSISLEQLNSIQLLKRKETKFAFSQSRLPEILKSLKRSYRTLEINTQRIFSYENQYYDTHDFFFYRQHHNGSRSRYKVRVRKYLESNSYYFEIKKKNNQEITTKTRIRIPNSIENFNIIPSENTPQFIERAKEMIVKVTDMNPEELFPKLNIKFSRITLVDMNAPERITIDARIIAGNKTREQNFIKLVIAEVKQDRYNPRSEFIKEMRRIVIPEMRFSKYCLGIIHNYNNVKCNRFKPKILRIEKIMSEDNLKEIK